jgi:MinD superfamily P-loop ATPase
MKIAIASGKGGTGKTTIAVNLYHTIAKYFDAEVMLADCDVEEPNDALFFEHKKFEEEQPVELQVPLIDPDKCTFCRKCVEYCEFNAITVIPPLHHAEVSTDLCHACGACLHACDFGAIKEYPYEIGKIRSFRLPYGSGLTEGRLNVGSALQTPVIRFLKSKLPSSEKIILFDAPPGTSCSVVTTISDADFVILVTEPTPFGLHDLKLTIELVREMEKPFGVVINKSGIGNDELKKYVQKENIMIIAEIPFSREIAKHYSDNKLLAESVEGYWEYFFGMLDKIFKIVLK